MIYAKEPESPGMIDVSTVIVNWNSRQYLAKCLDTMLSHKRTIRVEVIVVDNASSDGAVGWLKKEYPEVTVIESTENVGFARGNNMGIRKASGRYICLVNPDVEFRDECLQTLCEFMERNQDVAPVALKYSMVTDPFSTRAGNTRPCGIICVLRWASIEYFRTAPHSATN